MRQFAYLGDGLSFFGGKKVLGNALRSSFYCFNKLKQDNLSANEKYFCERCFFTPAIQRWLRPIDDTREKS
jgi:hypothetical protein